MKNKIFQSRDLCLRTLDTNSTCAKCVRRNEEKMEVLLAKSAGFCFGVKRAVDRVYELAQTSAKIYTYGPIIHNEEVVGDLEKKGVSVIETKEELSQIKEGVIVIRSHGVAKEIYDQIEQQGLECVDATCPFVKRIHNIVEKESANGKQILIIGNAGHPEVEGIMGWSSTPAMVALMRLARVAARMARIPRAAISPRRFGAIPPSPPRRMPRLPRLAKPVRAKVTIA